MTAVTIPAELAADVKARREAYRPHVASGVEVLVLACEGSVRAGDHAGMVGEVAEIIDQDWPIQVTIPGRPFWCNAREFALVGSVDGGPRPAIGQRVLVLDGSEDAIGRVGEVAVAGGHGFAVVFGEDQPSGTCTRWALLPDAEPATPCPPVKEGAWVRITGCADASMHHENHIGRVGQANHDSEPIYDLEVVLFDTSGDVDYWCLARSWELAERPVFEVGDPEPAPARPEDGQRVRLTRTTVVEGRYQRSMHPAGVDSIVQSDAARWSAAVDVEPGDRVEVLADSTGDEVPR